MSRTDSLSRRRSRRDGFTLVEVMIAATISVVVLAGILTTFLMIGRSGYNAANYSMMEAESRRALEQFTSDARMAINIDWNGSDSVTLRVVTSGSNQQVTYTYDSDPLSPTYQCFYRKLGDAASGATPLILVRNVTDFAFRRYKIINGVDYTANNDLETKQIQITLRSIRTGATTVAATNAVLSARVVLRNKPVTT